MCPVPNCMLTTGRMWSVTFFSTDPSSSADRRLGNRENARIHGMSWSAFLNRVYPPFFDSQLIVNCPTPFGPRNRFRLPRLREARSTTLSCLRATSNTQSQSSMYDYNYDGKAISTITSGSQRPRVPSEEGQISILVFIINSRHLLTRYEVHPRLRDRVPQRPRSPIRLGCGNRKLGSRAGAGGTVLEFPPIVASRITYVFMQNP
jgi:hypothetical protein